MNDCFSLCNSTERLTGPLSALHVESQVLLSSQHTVPVLPMTLSFLQGSLPSFCVDWVVPTPLVPKLIIQSIFLVTETFTEPPDKKDHPLLGWQSYEGITWDRSA